VGDLSAFQIAAISDPPAGRRVAWAIEDAVRKALEDKLMDAKTCLAQKDVSGAIVTFSVAIESEPHRLRARARGAKVAYGASPATAESLERCFANVQVDLDLLPDGSASFLKYRGDYFVNLEL
jgi:hypothetical protein